MASIISSQTTNAGSSTIGFVCVLTPKIVAAMATKQPGALTVAALNKSNMPTTKPACVLAVRTVNLAAVCAWCPDKQAGEAWCAAQGLAVTHSVCPSCAQIQLMTLKAMAQRYTNRAFPSPVSG